MYFVFKITKEHYLCVRDEHLDPIFVIPKTCCVLDSYNPFTFCASNKRYCRGYMSYDAETGVTYLHMYILDNLPKFGLLVVNHNLLTQETNYTTCAHMIDEFSLENSEIGDLVEITCMIQKVKSVEDLLFCLRLAIPILHKYNFYNLRMFQNTYNYYFNSILYSW